MGVTVPVYQRLRLFWGAFDYELNRGQAPAYTSAQTVTGGTSAAPGSGIGVRKAQLKVNRTLGGVVIDPAVMHFSFLNMTSGSPDDTWTTSDYTSLETLINTWWAAMAAYMPSSHAMTEIRWYRTGTGVTPPNPPERILIVSSPVAGSVSGTTQLAQAACSITFRTGSRRHWGRTYLPYLKPTDISLRPLAADVDAIANATNTLTSGAASNDMHLVVVCDSITSSLNVENISVDNVLDVVRRRRLKQTTYRKILP